MAEALVHRTGSEPGRFRSSLAGSSVAGGEQSEGDGWLLIYLDVITLMLTLFVVLLAFTEFDAVERSPETPVVEAFLEPPVLPVLELPSAPAQTVIAPSEPDPVAEPVPALELPDLADGIDVEVEAGRISFRIRDNLLFSSGEAGLTAEGYAVLDSLVPTLRASADPLSVEGHTDNLPIATERFPSNWELSVARASVVLRYLESRGVESERLRAIGYADTRPLADNATVEGRARNRRVQLVLHREEL
ncbi:MAG: OmpA family protein [Ectothiorhodospiraceae bacterium]|nr:OmpA family protein [Ectothiorhodospiraceae bacterium]MCH8504095.1 OmpA family protein [Ectothiorhodospiraceae bacterium]